MNKNLSFDELLTRIESLDRDFEEFSINNVKYEEIVEEVGNLYGFKHIFIDLKKVKKADIPKREKKQKFY